MSCNMKCCIFQVQFTSVNCLKNDKKSVTQKQKYNENTESKRFKNKISKYRSAGSRSMFPIFRKDFIVTSSKCFTFVKAESFKKQIWHRSYIFFISMKFISIYRLRFGDL